MKTEVLYDYGVEGKITATAPEEEIYEVYAKIKIDGVDCSGGSLADEGPPMGCCGV